MFIIEDELHCEPMRGEYRTFKDAVTELHRLAEISWQKKPNQAPCTSWRTCGRKYVILEYDITTKPWKMISRRDMLEIDADGVRWDD